MNLTGIDGTGTGLVVHEKALGKVFHVQCLHIPVGDRTHLEGLIQIVEETVMIEHDLCPNRPIYLLGESFGGTLALAVAARNPTIDLILVLANPATSYERSPMHPLVALIRALPDEHYGLVSYALIPFLGNYIKMQMVKLNGTDPSSYLWRLLGNIAKDLPLFSMIARILPKDTLTWRMKLAELGAAYVNSRLHAITAEVLILASGTDYLLPSEKEAKRLSRFLKHCKVRVFEDNGHTILLENGVDLLSTIKSTQTYRPSTKRDVLKDFVPLSMTEFKNLPTETWLYRLSIAPAMFSTMEDGRIVRGLAGIPEEGPVVIVGNHMLYGFDVYPLVTEFLREKKTTLLSLAHPVLFDIDAEEDRIWIPFIDMVKQLGIVPVSGMNLFRILTRKSYTLLYPGGVREALHRKGEDCKLFWPAKQEFVKMAVKFGATIIPYAGVGEDDILELLVDYNDMKRTPFLNRMVTTLNEGKTNLREGMDGEVAEQHLHFPIILPKLPGRLYFLFGKPIRTKGKVEMLNDEDYLQDLYTQIKCDVEKSMAYLLKKREEDPYRGLGERLLWLKTHGSLDRIPSFEP